MSSSLKHQEAPLDRVIITAMAAEVALRELNNLINDTKNEEPDPLTDDVFRARDEIAAALATIHSLKELGRREEN